MGKYCCFFDPAISYEEKKLDDVCPVCGRPYRFVLDNVSQTIKKENVEYKVLESKGRGFYGATYLCEVKKNRFRTEKVLLKVIPVEVYKFFKKDFYKECEAHISAAENAEHLIDLYDAFETTVTFGDKPISCYVEELKYINGVSLNEYVSDESHATARIYAQITIDLLSLWNELNQKGEFHNDLHLENIMVEMLEPNVERVNAIYTKIRLVAIDLNSLADGSRSDEAGIRIGDRRYIAKHIEMLSEKLRVSNANKYEMLSTNNRLIMAMKKIAMIFYDPAHASDQPEATELINMLKHELESNVSYAPWLQTFTLSRINDYHNAQTLPSCNVPKLLIDPGNQWLSRISTRTPQLITGMRGCGKTMLLKALDIHARLNIKESNTEKIKIVQDDSFVGLMANCREIVRLSNIEEEGITKLLLLYSIEILRAARHVRDIDSDKVKKDFHKDVALALESIFDIHFDVNDLNSDYSFESYITYLSNYVPDFCKKHHKRMTTITSFELLASVVNTVSELFHGKEVFFLLDDVSTRYLNIDKIEELLTLIIFMSEKCAFKVTTEVQTISFRSPGNVEVSREVRDYDIFDLGADVYAKTRDPENAKDFIEKIINKRLENSVGYEKVPRSLTKVLDDVELATIARHIITSTKDSELHKTYFGATALVSLCVGDIGDVIGLYDSIIDSNGSTDYPVDYEIQSAAFQRLCSHRMISLEGKRTTMARLCVKAFAEASNSDLKDSYKPGGKKRIRQYNQIHISNITSEKQFEYIRTLIDAGVFVPYDTTGFSRNNERLIKLAFRKLFGLAYFIPLGNSDRYLLSGDAFEKWVQNPSKDQLISNAGNKERNSTTDAVFPNDGINTFASLNEQIKVLTGYQKIPKQISIFDEDNKNDDEYDEYNKYKVQIKDMIVDSIINGTHIIPEKDIISNEHYDIAVFGMGFEDRSPESMKRVIEQNTFDNIVLVEYDEKGHSEEIQRLAKTKCPNPIIVKYNETDIILQHIKPQTTVMIDVTGLIKPIIFSSICYSLNKNCEVTIVHTMAEEYYPLNSDIERTKKQQDINNPITFSEMMRDLITGEEGEYKNNIVLFNDNYDPVRPRAMVGFVSPKNQRIFNLLNEVEYEKAVLLVPNGETFRDILSKAAGSIAEINYSGITKTETDLTNPDNVLKEITRCYIDLSIDQQCNFDLALTGSKMQAVAAAVFSAIVPITHCWYVSPERFMTDRFTKGIGETKCYKISIERHTFEELQLT